MSAGRSRNRRRTAPSSRPPPGSAAIAWSSAVSADAIHVPLYCSTTGRSTWIRPPPPRWGVTTPRTVLKETGPLWEQTTTLGPDKVPEDVEPVGQLPRSEKPGSDKVPTGLSESVTPLSVGEEVEN